MEMRPVKYLFKISSQRLPAEAAECIWSITVIENEINVNCSSAGWQALIRKHFRDLGTLYHKLMTIFIIPKHADNSSIYSINCRWNIETHLSKLVDIFTIFSLSRKNELPKYIITSPLVFDSHELNALNLICNLCFPSRLSYSASCFQPPSLCCWLMKLNCDGWTFKSKATVRFVILKRSTSLTSTHHNRFLTGTVRGVQ